MSGGCAVALVSEGQRLGDGSIRNAEVVMLDLAGGSSWKDVPTW